MSEAPTTMAATPTAPSGSFIRSPAASAKHAT